MTRPLQAQNQSPLRGFFRDLIWEVVPWQTGVTDRPTLDYLAELLARFAATSQLYRFRDLAGRRLFQVADLLAEAEHKLGGLYQQRERELRRHVGDLTLFWVGVFPEALPRLQASPRLDSMLDYVNEGRRAYHQVSLFEHEPYRSQAPVFRRLSTQFELFASGLQATRGEWERRSADNFRSFRNGIRR